jgi:putative FmdB family regulatory protein
MPKYLLKCSNCGNQEERLRSMKGYKDPMLCSKCGETKIPKVVITGCPAVFLNFKGSCTRDLVNKKVDEVPDCQFIPDNPKDTVPGKQLYNESTGKPLEVSKIYL